MVATRKTINANRHKLVHVAGCHSSAMTDVFGLSNNKIYRVFSPQVWKHFFKNIATRSGHYIANIQNVHLMIVYADPEIRLV